MEISALNEQHASAPKNSLDTLPRPERRENRLATVRHENLSNGRILLDPQAACGFTYPASKHAPFFQSVSVMAVILRARVRRAISGFIPLTSRLA